MRRVHDLSVEELRRIVTHVQYVLWLDNDDGDPTWNSEKFWDASTIDEVAWTLIAHGLQPDEERHS